MNVDANQVIKKLRFYDNKISVRSLVIVRNDNKNEKWNNIKMNIMEFSADIKVSLNI